jgi:hypothetical protein
MTATRLLSTLVGSLLLIGVVLSGAAALDAQTLGLKERFTAVAIVNNNLGSGAGIVQIDVTRWSTQSERASLLGVLQKSGADKLLDALQDMRPVGTIKTPDSLAYDLRYANQTPMPEGGRRIVLATDRPIGFWEATRRPRTIDYPFTVIQMEVDRNGEGKGTLSYATKIITQGDTIVLENFATQPIMLTQIKSEARTE